MIVLRHAKFISGSRVYRVGEILPDTAGTRELVARGFAEEVNTAKSSKPAKKKEQPVQPVVTQSQPEPVTQIVQDTQQNAQGNS